MDEILELAKELKNAYGNDAGSIIDGTIDRLCDKGIAKSCFQDYNVLFDILSVFDLFKKNC